MALVLGTSCGFVTTAPTVNPEGIAALVDTEAIAFKDTAPANIDTVTEIGWYCDNATEAADFDVGIYTNGGAVVGTLSKDNAKGTTAGWKVITGLNIPVTPGTIYWMAMQVDNTSTQTDMNWSVVSGKTYHNKISQTSLPNPWGSTTSTKTGRVLGVYAKVELLGPVGIKNRGSMSMLGLL